MEPFIQHLIDEESDRQANYRQCRDYYDGRQGVKLSERQRRYLHVQPGQEFSANYMHIVVDSLATRLNVVGFDVPGDKALTKELNRWMRIMRISSLQNGVHTSAIRDGDAYGFVDWNPSRKAPRLIPHLAYDGTRDGVHVHYNTETAEPMIFTKRWLIEAGSDLPVGARRLNVYHADRVERYWSHASTGQYGWMPWSGNGLSTVTRYTTGFPLVHFTNRARGFLYGLSELSPGIPMQDAINKAVIDLLAAADASGFRIMVAIGFDPSGLTLAPGSFIADPDHTPDEASVVAIPGEALRPHIETVDSFVQRLGQVTDTPLSYFQQSGQMASEGTHRQHETRAIAKARTASVELGEQWEELMRACIRLSNAFGGTRYDEDAEIELRWADFDIRDLETKMKLRAEAMKAIVEAVEVGAGVEEAALAVGFTAEQAKRMGEVEYVTIERENRQQAANVAAMAQRARGNGNSGDDTEDNG